MPDPLDTADAAYGARRVDADSPWLGLLPFTEETQRFFFGRDAEIREIFLRVRDQTLTILYGQSGYGKTSLLNAGLIPKLRADCFRPVLLRLRFENCDSSLIEQVRAALTSACADQTESAQRLLDRWGNASLWEFFHNPNLQPGRLAKTPPVLIFDQFEEIFTLSGQRSRTEIEAFSTELADLVENRPPVSVQARLADDLDFANEMDYSPSPLRLIITLREDFLSYLEAWKGAMPSLMRNRMALQLLRGPQALEAIVRPGRLEGRNLVSDEVGTQIVRVIARRGPTTPLEEIEAVPPLLSLLCDELNRARDGALSITAELVEKKHGDILEQFYARCFAGFPPAVRSFIEDRLVTVSGHRNLVAREDAESELSRSGVPDPAGAINTLLARRLLSAEEHGGTQRVEITHDVLAALVTDSRNKRQERERAERAENERQALQKQAEEVARETFRASLKSGEQITETSTRLRNTYSELRLGVLRNAMESSSVSMRFNAAALVGDERDSSLGPLLVDLLLKERADQVRRAAAYSLVQLDEPELFAFVIKSINHAKAAPESWRALAELRAAADASKSASSFDSLFEQLDRGTRSRISFQSARLRLRRGAPLLPIVLLPVIVFACASAAAFKWLPGLFNFAFCQATPSAPEGVFHAIIAAVVWCGSIACGLALYFIVFGHESVPKSYLRPHGAIVAGFISGTVSSAMLILLVVTVYTNQALMLMGWTNGDYGKFDPRLWNELLFVNRSAWPYLITGTSLGLGMALMINGLRASEHWSKLLKEQSALVSGHQVSQLIRALLKLGLRFAGPVFMMLSLGCLVAFAALRNAPIAQHTDRSVWPGALSRVGAPANPYAQSAFVDETIREWKLSPVGEALGIAGDGLAQAIGGSFGIIGMALGIVVARHGIKIEPGKNW